MTPSAGPTTSRSRARRSTPIWPIFDLDGDGVPDHIGMFDRWLDADETRFQTVEGNVSLSGEPNGGRVLQRERHRAQTFAFVYARFPRPFSWRT